MKPVISQGQPTSLPRCLERRPAEIGGCKWLLSVAVSLASIPGSHPKSIMFIYPICLAVIQYISSTARTPTCRLNNQIHHQQCRHSVHQHSRSYPRPQVPSVPADRAQHRWTCPSLVQRASASARITFPQSIRRFMSPGITHIGVIRGLVGIRWMGRVLPLRLDHGVNHRHGQDYLGSFRAHFRSRIRLFRVVVGKEHSGAMRRGLEERRRKGMMCLGMAMRG